MPYKWQVNTDYRRTPVVKNINWKLNMHPTPVFPNTVDPDAEHHTTLRRRRCLGAMTAPHTTRTAAHCLLDGNGSNVDKNTSWVNAQHYPMG